MPEILPCPFCGQRAHLVHDQDAGGDLHMAVQCTGEGCWATIECWLSEEAAEEAIKAWNRRASGEVPHVAELRKDELTHGLITRTPR